MKNIFLLTILISFFSINAMSQELILTGYQTKGVSNNAKLECQGLTIQKTMKVVSVTGENSGFWIVNGSKTIKIYWTKNDPQVIGLQLTPGTYYVYPNLVANTDKSVVNLTLK